VPLLCARLPRPARSQRSKQTISKSKWCFFKVRLAPTGAKGECFGGVKEKNPATHILPTKCIYRIGISRRKVRNCLGCRPTDLFSFLSTQPPLVNIQQSVSFLSLQRLQRPATAPPNHPETSNLLGRAHRGVQRALRTAESGLHVSDPRVVVDHHFENNHTTHPPLLTHTTFYSTSNQTQLILQFYTGNGIHLPHSKNFL